MRSLLRPALVLLALFTLATGVLYPLLITAVAQLAFAEQANGSLVASSERPIGSALIGQPFTSPRYFWGRPSATSPAPYQATASTGSNLGPSNPALHEAVRGRVAAHLAAAPSRSAEPVPIELVTTSGSGLDPHLSPAGALYQVPRVARARGLDEAALRELVKRQVEQRLLGLIGEPVVNVLALNLALDRLTSAADARTHQ